MISCRVIKAYGTYRKGDIVTPMSAILREQLLFEKLVEIVRDDDEKMEYAIATPNREKAVRRRGRKKVG